MRVEVISTDGLSESVKSKIKSTMKFTKWWKENDTMFCQLENESGDIIRIFPERVKPFHSFARLEDVKEVSRERKGICRFHDEKAERVFLPSVLTIPINYWVDDEGVRHIDYDLIREKYEEEMWKLRTLKIN